MDSTTLAYIAGFLDGDGSIFFQIVPRKDYKQKFQIRSSIAFRQKRKFLSVLRNLNLWKFLTYQKKNYVEILEWLKNYFGVGYIRHRKTGISDYTIVESKEVKKILLLLQPYVKLKRKQIELSLEILSKLENKKSTEDFLETSEIKNFWWPSKFWDLEEFWGL